MRDYDRSEITFEQAEGLEPLPSQMALKTLTNPLRARLSRLVMAHIQHSTTTDVLGNYEEIGFEWGVTYSEFFIARGYFPKDINLQYHAVEATLDELFRKGSYAKVLGFIEFCVRHHPDDFRRRQLEEAASQILAADRCAYRLIERSIIPLATDEERDTVIRAFATLEATNLRGAKAHLQKAGSHLTAGQCADSIRESIHAVESVARTVTGERSLQMALAKIAKDHPLHPALKSGFNSIYGYASDEEGIRHPMLESDAPNVGEPEAIFMLGACASFVTYLTQIGREGAK